MDLTRDELIALDELVSLLIQKGQPITHIMRNHGDEIPCSERTLYHYIDAGYLTARNIDMHRMVRYRKRNHYIVQPKMSYRKKKDTNMWIIIAKQDTRSKRVSLKRVMNT